jgi:hypothetical protein
MRLDRMIEIAIVAAYAVKQQRGRWSWNQDWYHGCLNRRQKLTMAAMHVSLAWYYVLDELQETDNVTEDLAFKLDLYDRRRKWLQPICTWMDAHVVDNDHCGRADHRYCLACEKITPNQELSIVVPKHVMDAWNAKLQRMKEASDG